MRKYLRARVDAAARRLCASLSCCCGLQQTTKATSAPAIGFDFAQAASENCKLSSGSKQRRQTTASGECKAEKTCQIDEKCDDQQQHDAAAHRDGDRVVGAIGVQRRLQIAGMLAEDDEARVRLHRHVAAAVGDDHDDDDDDFNYDGDNDDNDAAFRSRLRHTSAFYQRASAVLHVVARTPKFSSLADKGDRSNDEQNLATRCNSHANGNLAAGFEQLNCILRLEIYRIVTVALLLILPPPPPLTPPLGSENKAPTFVVRSLALKLQRRSSEGGSASARKVNAASARIPMSPLAPTKKKKDAIKRARMSKSRIV